MKKITKALLLTLCAVLLVVGTVLGTLAYLTDRSTVENTFTVGNVDIKVDESDVNENGEQETTPEGETKPRVEENEYHLLPGETYIKDPTMTVLKGSEESYVRMMVTITHSNALKAIFGEDFLPEEFVSGWDREIWPCVSIKDNGNYTITYEFRYKITVDASDAAEDIVLEPLFTHINVPGNLTGEQMKDLAGMQIIVEGHAIQTASFEDVTDENGVTVTAEDAAWAAFEQQYSAANP